VSATFAPRHPTGGWCRGCRTPAEPGALLVVTPVDGAPWLVHRPSVSGRCFGVVPRRELATIQEADPAAAALWDREHADGAPDPDQRRAEYARSIGVRETVRHRGMNVEEIDQ